MLALPARYGRWGTLAVPVALIIFFIHFLTTNFATSSLQVVVEPEPYLTTDADADAYADADAGDEIGFDSDTKFFSCRPLEGIDDVLVVLKTGITEAQEKVPVHLRTTLRCIPHKMIVSDFEEDIAGERTYDVFRDVSETLKQTNDDFALYNRARDGGRAALTSQDRTKVANGPSGMMDNPGWKLDKWKFLPMIHTVRATRPDARWYVFLEADTYPVWPNLLAWLARFSPDDRLYLGNPMMIGEDIFAHGGSGFVLSRAAIHTAADYHAEHAEDWDKITEMHWAGDGILGKVLAEAGIQLTWSWPHVTISSVWESDPFREWLSKEPWCYPPFTFHHMTPIDVDRLWEFDHLWFADESHNLLTYGDIFRELIRPTLADHLDNWDNFAKDGDDQENYSGPSTPASLADCAEYCASFSDCMQYRVDSNGRCTTSTAVLRGIPQPGVQSGTMIWRVDAAVKRMGKCEEPKWVV